MGGHSAWKKRVANGGLAKGAGGAICRHRPRWGRKGKDLIKNRKGNIGEGNPKKRKFDKESRDVVSESSEKLKGLASVHVIAIVGIVVASLLLIGSVYYAATLRYR
jgi:hypothetical protein